MLQLCNVQYTNWHLWNSHSKYWSNIALDWSGSLILCIYKYLEEKHIIFLTSCYCHYVHYTKIAWTDLHWYWSRHVSEADIIHTQTHTHTQPTHAHKSIWYTPQSRRKYYMWYFLPHHFTSSTTHIACAYRSHSIIFFGVCAPINKCFRSRASSPKWYQLPPPSPQKVASHRVVVVVVVHWCAHS